MMLMLLDFFKDSGCAQEWGQDLLGIINHNMCASCLISPVGRVCRLGIET